MTNINFLMKGLNFICGKIEGGVELLPEEAQNFIFKKTTSFLKTVLTTNLKTIYSGKEFKKPSKKAYKVLVTT